VIHKMNVCMALIVLLTLTASALAQSKDSGIGDDYAKAALRAVIYTNESGISMERVSFLLDEADVEASTAAEEANLKELNRILFVWITRPRQDNQVCYQTLKMNLKARNGAIPEACK
jgi:hypothetical protein